MSTVFEPLAPVIEREAWPRRVRLFGVAMDVVTMGEAVAVVTNWLGKPFDQCRYIVTPNVDHVVLLRQDAGLRAAYADAGLVLADGWPVVVAAKLLGKALPERVAGSDLVPALFQAIQHSRSNRVFLLGAAPGVADRAAVNIEARWPTVRIVGIYSPALGFESQAAENKHILNVIAEAKPDLLIVGFGAPKQELWVHRHFDRIRAKAVVCAGATIDFLAGEKNRAPRWMRRVGLEWFHRLVTEPRRMAKRYLRDAWVFPQLVWEEWRNRSGITVQRPVVETTSSGHVPTARDYPVTALRSDDKSFPRADWP